ncbi:UNVERIFIED_CONTAM: hypothetical protein HDU68_005336 [Siphonaria sp. JEL0065]|nr:hypothetical protein HDU68_005336 [Siphonaria sp. JEL0065]
MGRNTIDMEFNGHGSGNLHGSQSAPAQGALNTMSQTKSYDGGTSVAAEVEETESSQTHSSYSESGSQTNSFNSSTPEPLDLDSLEIHGNVKARSSPKEVKGEKSLKLWRPGGLSEKKTDLIRLNSQKMKDLNERIRNGLRNGKSASIEVRIDRKETPQIEESKPNNTNLDEEVNQSSLLKSAIGSESQALIKGKNIKKKTRGKGGDLGTDKGLLKSNSSINSIGNTIGSRVENRSSIASSIDSLKQDKKTIKREDSSIMQFVKLIDALVSPIESTPTPDETAVPESKRASSVVDIVTCNPDNGTLHRGLVEANGVELTPKNALGPLKPLVKVPVAAKDKAHRHKAFVQDIRENNDSKEVVVKVPQESLSLRQLEIQFMKDYTFMEKRAVDKHINFIQQYNRDVNVFGDIKIEPVDWIVLKDMIFNFFLFLKALPNPIVDTDLTQLIVEIMDEELQDDEKVTEFKKLFVLLPKQYSLQLKINFKHLHRLATVLTDLPEPLYSSISSFFANLLFRAPSRQNKAYQSTAETATIAISEAPTDTRPRRLYPTLQRNSNNKSLPPSPSINNLRSSQRDLRSPKIKGLWKEEELQNSRSSLLQELHNSRNSLLQETSSPLRGSCSSISSSLSNISTQNVPGFRAAIPESKLSQPPREFPIPANSPFSPKVDDLATESENSEMEAEFDSWFLSKVVKDMSNNAKTFKDTEKAHKQEKEKEKLQLQMKLEKKRQREKEELQERCRFLWGKVRLWVQRLGAKKLAEKLTARYKAIENEINERKGSINHVTYEKKVIIAEDQIADPDGFGWTHLSKEDLEAKIFLEETCSTATTAALKLILQNLEDLFE